MAPPADGSSSPACVPCRGFDRLNVQIRDGLIPKREARQAVARLLPEIREFWERSGGRRYGRDAWVFPLKGYSAKAIEGGRNHGYLSGRYDYFDGNRHGGHPSLDIFIRDRDQDDRDDRIGGYVAVLSVTGGIVVSVEHDWQPGSRLRGGRYVWVYDPVTDMLVYYAHLRELTVRTGETVKPGAVLGFVGRSGLNAWKRRSPTHLHLTCLSTSSGTPVPVNIYPDLVTAGTVD